MTDYQCVLLGTEWHATQEQAAPPPAWKPGVQTLCSRWAPLVQGGYERRRPTCEACLAACLLDESRRETTKRVRNPVLGRGGAK